MTLSNVVSGLFSLGTIYLFLTGSPALHLVLCCFVQLVIFRLVISRLQLVLNLKGTLKFLLLCVPTLVLFTYTHGPQEGPYLSLACAVLGAMYLIQTERRWYGFVIELVLAKRGAWFVGDELKYKQYEAFAMLHYATIEEERLEEEKRKENQD